MPCPRVRAPGRASVLTRACAPLPTQPGRLRARAQETRSGQRGRGGGMRGEATSSAWGRTTVPLVVRCVHSSVRIKRLSSSLRSHARDRLMTGSQCPHAAPPPLPPPPPPSPPRLRPHLCPSPLPRRRCRPLSAGAVLCSLLGRAGDFRRQTRTGRMAGWRPWPAQEERDAGRKCRVEAFGLREDGRVAREDGRVAREDGV